MPSIKGRKTQQNKNVDSQMRLRSKVLLGESRAALVQTMEELVEMANVNGGKVLMVDCKEEGCVEDVPDLWKRVQLTRDAGQGLFQLSVDGDFILEKKEFTAMISSQLLPVAYSFAPDLVVLRSSSFILIGDDLMTFSGDQLHHHHHHNHRHLHHHHHQDGIRCIGFPPSRTFSAPSAAGFQIFTMQHSSVFGEVFSVNVN